MLQLYYDGLCISNPLRGQALTHNCSNFFFTIPNLPPRFNSALANIHLVAICNRIDLKKDNNFQVVLQNIKDEIKSLEEHGM